MAGTAGMSEEEIRKLKREGAIAQRDREMKRKAEEADEKKRRDLERVKIEYEEQEKKRQNEKFQQSVRLARLRAERKDENERLQEKRAKKVLARDEVWLKEENVKIQDILVQQEAEETRVSEKLDEARAKKAAKEREVREAKQDAEIAQEDLDAKREENIEKLATARTIRAALQTDEIKEEAQNELLSFIQNPFPVPLKQSLCGKLRPVPSVTELLSSHRDANEDFEELKEQDFEMRAVIRNTTLLKYVKEIQAQAEERRIRPPEPNASDLMRKTNKKPQSPKAGGTNRKGAASPTAKKGFAKRGN